MCLSMCYETLHTFCDSLRAHPTLVVMGLRVHCTNTTVTTPAILKSRMQVLVYMMQMNISIHTIHLDTISRQHKLVRGSIIPYLETNRLRPRLLAIQKHAQVRTVQRFWDERFLLYEPIPIAFGCFYQGMPKLPFCRRLRTSLRLLMLPQFLLHMLLLLLLPLL